MAPIGHSATAQAETAIRDTIQSLYNVMLHTSAYDAAGSHTSLDALVAEVRILSQALRDVNEVAEQASSGSSGGDGSINGASSGLPAIPRDLVQYVEAGRNPDIYTREFVELVRRTNQLRAGKRGAFAQFRDTLAGQIRSALPELSSDVDQIMRATAETQQEQQQQQQHSAGGLVGTTAGGAAAVAAAAGIAPTSSSTTTTTTRGTSVGTTDGSKSTLVGDAAAPATLMDGLNANGNAATGTSAGAAAAAAADAGSADANRSFLSTSASASPAHHPGSGNSNGTPSGGSGPATIDMLGILPSTPQPSASSSGAAGLGGGSGGSGPTGSGGAGGHDAMETS
ncbi:MAG: RNA polymerase II mediator complex subunit [Sporothrix thermara]